MNLLVHFVIYGHSWCFESSQIALAYGSCNFENFQSITRAHKSRNAPAFIRFPILITNISLSVPVRISLPILNWNAHNIDLFNLSLQPNQVSTVAENVLRQVLQLVVTQVPVRKKIDITVLNTYGFQNSWQIPLSRGFKPLLSLSKVCFTFAQIFHFKCPFFLKYYVDQVIKVLKMKKWEYDSTVVKWTNFPAKYLYGCIDYEPMIFNHFLFEITWRWTT